MNGCRLPPLGLLGLLCLVAAAPLGAQSEFSPRGPVVALNQGCSLEPALLRSGDGSEHVALWYSTSEEPGIYVRHWDGPEPVGNAFRIVDGIVQSLRAAPHPDGFLVVWTAENQLRFQIFRANPLQPTHAVVEVAASPVANSDGPALAAGPGGDFTLAWRTEDGGIAARRFAATGVPTTPRIEVAAGPQTINPRLAVSDAGFLVGWTLLDPILVPYLVVARAFDPAGVPLGAEVEIGSGSAGAFAANASGYLALRLDDLTYGRALATDGQPLGAETPLPYVYPPLRLAPAAAGTLLAYSYENALFATVLDGAAQPSEPASRLVPNPGYWPNLSSLETENDGFHIAWSEGGNFPIPIPCSPGLAAFGQFFGPAGYVEVPALSPGGALLSALLLAIAGAWGLRRAG